MSRHVQIMALPAGGFEVRATDGEVSKLELCVTLDQAKKTFWKLCGFAFAIDRGQTLEFRSPLRGIGPVEIFCLEDVYGRR